VLLDQKASQRLFKKLINNKVRVKQKEEEKLDYEFRDWRDCKVLVRFYSWRVLSQVSQGVPLTPRHWRRDGTGWRRANRQSSAMTWLANSLS
jgi:hypothetical protein